MPARPPPDDPLRSPPIAATVEILERLDDLEALAGPWGELSDARDRPACAPEWALAWARHISSGRPRVAVVREAGELIGLLPLTAERSRTGAVRLRLLGAGTSAGLEPLARPGREEEAAALCAPALAAAEPRAEAIAFEGIRVDSPWPGALARHWPGARTALLHEFDRMPEPHVSLAAGSFADWQQTRSASFRSQLKKVRRRLEERGVTTRRATTRAELERDLDAFLCLHHARWRDRGGSAVVTPGVERMLLDAAPALLLQGRMDVWSIEAEGEVICSQINLATPGQVTMWLGGYDEAWSDARLTFACFAAVIEDGFARGIPRISLGSGGQEYKYRFADFDETLACVVLPLPGPRLPLVLGGLKGRRLRASALERLGDERKARLRALVRR